jgi:hypothetical protein
MNFNDEYKSNYKGVRLAVCIPARDMMHTATTYAIWHLASYLKTLGIESNLFMSPGTLIANQRHELVRCAYDWNATHLLFIDSDMMFDPIHAVRLLDFDEDVVGAAYSKRVDPLIVTAWTHIDKWDTWVRPLEQTESHIPVEAMGLGFCLIKMSVFDKIDLPWFQLGFNKERQQYTGEDIEFFRKCKKKKIKVWLDVQTTMELGHLGTKNYKVDDEVVVTIST